LSLPGLDSPSSTASSIFDLSLLQNTNKKHTNIHPKQKNAAAPTPNIVDTNYVLSDVIVVTIV
jgi:hypothetical protein